MADGPGGKDWLSRTLRELRPGGLSATRAARAAGLSQSRLSRIESGIFVPTPDEVGRLCSLYRIPAATRRSLLETAHALRSEVTPARVVISHGSWKMQRRIEMAERNATEICGYQPALIHGLLQTADYARLVFADGGLITGDDLDAAVAARMGRASVLDSGRSLVLIMAEGALRWQAGSPEVMLAQLAHLTVLISTRPAVRIGFVAQSSPARVFTTHGFSMYDRRTVSFGVRTGTTFISDPADVAEYAELFGELERLAVFGDEALAVLTRVAAGYAAPQ